MKEEKKKREKKAGVIVSRPSVKRAGWHGSAMLPRPSRPPPRQLAWF
jgi:hypothetical protein